MRSYYERNKEKQLALSKKRYAEKREEILAASKARIKADPEKYRAIFKQKRLEWEAKHPGYHRALNRRKYAEYRDLVFKAYGEKCYCCGESHWEFLTIDHIHGDGKIDREKHGNRFYRVIAEAGFPKDRFRLACMNCNWVMRKGAICPHQRKGEEVNFITSC